MKKLMFLFALAFVFFACEKEEQIRPDLVKVTLVDLDGDPVVGAKVFYQVGNLEGMAKTDSRGGMMLHVPQNTMNVSVSYNLPINEAETYVVNPLLVKQGFTYEFPITEIGQFDEEITQLENDWGYTYYYHTYIFEVPDPIQLVTPQTPYEPYLEPSLKMFSSFSGMGSSNTYYVVPNEGETRIIWNY